MSESSVWTCPQCGKARTNEPRPEGHCFACHLKGVGFTWVGGGGYGRENFHNTTIAEETRNIVDKSKAKGVSIEYAGSSWYSGPT